MNKFSEPIIAPELILGLGEHELFLVPEFNCLLHIAAVQPLRNLAKAAETVGFCLQVASSYRNFERQLLIWNHKANGLRAVLDSNGEPIDMTKLTDKEKVFAILRWSALPGASRHHWGTDLDIYDSSRVSPNYSLQLTVAETQHDGPFAPFHEWLTVELTTKAQGFYRPYSQDVGGIAPEPWHLSYAPVANVYAAQLNEDILRAQLLTTNIALKDTILENLSEIFKRFIQR